MMTNNDELINQKILSEELVNRLDKLLFIYQMPRENRPNESFICSNVLLIRLKESFICSNESFICSNDLLIRPNESFICSNDLLIRPDTEFFYLAFLRRRRKYPTVNIKLYIQSCSS